MNFYFVTIHYKSRISEDFGDFQYTSLLGAYPYNSFVRTNKYKLRVVSTMKYHHILILGAAGQIARKLTTKLLLDSDLDII